jgi:hypothetical protein
MSDINSFFQVKKLCTPALVYFMLSITSILLIIIFTLTNKKLKSKRMMIINVLLIHFISVLFWSFILNLICKYVDIRVSWFLVIFPYLMSFLVYFFKLRK